MPPEKLQEAASQVRGDEALAFALKALDFFWLLVQPVIRGGQFPAMAIKPHQPMPVLHLPGRVTFRAWIFQY
jgi:hypothetical protein